MKTEDPFNLRPIWDALLDIYNDYAALCRKHGLRHYVTDGASLGARRHNGFIQWDDDLDISMPRPDYEKFLAIAQRTLPAHLKLVYWKNTPELPVLFAKIQDSRIERIREVERQIGRKLSNGLYLDIIPIDGYPVGKWTCRWIWIRDLFLIPIERYYIRDYHHLTKKGRIAWFCGMFLRFLVPWLNTPSKLLAIHDRSLRKFPFETAKFTGRCCQRPNVFRRVPVLQEIWGDPVEHEFDEQTVMVPHDLDAHLRNEYGPNFMTPPPAACRKPGHSLDWYYPWYLGPTGGANGS